MLIRQGDVMLIPLEALPQGAVAREDQTLALGEATGHSHVVVAGEVLVGEDGTLFVRASGATRLRHQDQSGAIAEHLPLDLEPGVYEVRIEEDYSPAGLTRVED
jgi:hypothetical protein